MDPNAQTYARPEAMGDVPGICELPLTRAVVQYRDVHEMDNPGGRIEDIGLALVVEGRYAASSEVIDLGSGSVKVLDLSTELVVLDWVYEPTLDHIASLITATASTQEEEPLRRYALKLGLRILERVGFGPLTRPTFLRIGFRDICRDFDLHEGTSIRFVLGPGRLTRAYLDYDLCAVVFKTAMRHPDPQLEHALTEAFPTADLCRYDPDGEADSIEYEARLALPTSFAEARVRLGAMRKGLSTLMARFEPARFDSLAPLIETLGERETSGRVQVQEPSPQAVRIASSDAGAQAIH